MKKMKVMTLASIVACAACSIRAGVYDDVTYWLRAPVDRDGDGLMSNVASDAECPDALHVTDLTQAINGAYSSANDTYKYAVEITNETVTSYYPIERTYSSVPCLHFNHATAKDPKTGVVMHVPARLNLPELFPYNYTDSYTAVLRVRYDGAMPICTDGTTTNLASRNVLLSLGYNEASAGSPNARGVALSFNNVTGEGTGYGLRIIFGPNFSSVIDPGDIGEVGCWANRPLVGRWVNIALRMDGTNRKAAVLWSTTSEWFHSREIDYPASATNVASITSQASIGYQTGKSPASNYDAYYLRAFKGSVSRCAIWHRALSDAEVKEAFADARPHRFQIGRTDGSSDEFAGSADGVTLSDEDDWSKAPAALTSALPSFAAKFPFDENPVSASNTVRALGIVAKMATNSGSGVLEASVNGTSLGKSWFSPAHPATWLAPASVLTNDNQLVLRHSSGGAARLDCVYGAASWQVGYKNNSGFKDGFGGDGLLSYNLGLEPFSKFGCAITGPGHSDHDRTIRLRLTEEEVARFRYRFQVCWNHYDQAETGMTTTNAVCVNGGTPVLQEIKSGFVTTTVNLDETNLVAGDNFIRLYRADRTDRGPQDYDEIDYVRFEPIKALQRAGFCIITR